MNWTQPICACCYSNRHPGWPPARLLDNDEQRCCDCGEMTKAGIYYRVDPRTVAFPTEDKPNDIHEVKP